MNAAGSRGNGLPLVMGDDWEREEGSGSFRQDPIKRKQAMGVDCTPVFSLWQLIKLYT